MLEAAAYQHAYVDGGANITSFIEHGLFDEICVTQLPVLLGDGLPLFGKTSYRVELSVVQTTLFFNNFIQSKYRLQKLR